MKSATAYVFVAILGYIVFSASLPAKGASSQKRLQKDEPEPQGDKLFLKSSPVLESYSVEPLQPMDVQLSEQMTVLRQNMAMLKSHLKEKRHGRADSNPSGDSN